MRRLPLVRVIGIGSPHGDDAAGWAVIDALQKMAPLSHCLFERAHGGHELLDRLDASECLILVDAIKTGGENGAMHQFTWPDERIEFLRAGATHLLGLPEVLKLAATLGILPQRIVIMGLEVSRDCSSEGLSPAVAAAAPEVARQIYELVSSYLHPPR